MIAAEHFQKISLKEALLTLVAAALLGVVILLLDSFLNPFALFLSSLLILVLGANFLISLTRKLGLALLFYVLLAAFTWNVFDTGALGWEKILVYFLAGLVLELAYLFLKIKIDFLPLDLIAGTSLSLGSLPLITAFIISAPLARQFPLALINLAILSFAVGMAAATLFSLAWSRLDRTKKILKFKSYLRSLGG